MRHQAGRRRIRAQQASLVRDLLREHLLSGGMRRGQRLPYEHTLGRQLGCSRNVLREALALLAADGLMSRERGRGTYVTRTSPLIDIDGGLDLAAVVSDARAEEPGDGPLLSYRVLQVGTVRATPLLASLLGRPAGAPVVHVERLVEVAGARVGHWDLHLPCGNESRIAALAGTHNSADLLRALRLAPETEEVRLEAVMPSPHTEELLYQGHPQPVLRMSRHFLDRHARVLALAIGRCALPAATFAVVRRWPAAG